MNSTVGPTIFTAKRKIFSSPTQSKRTLTNACDILRNNDTYHRLEDMEKKSYNEPKMMVNLELFWGEWDSVF